jgi:hypothetical protein
MSTIQCRGSIALATVVVALLSSGAADAQVIDRGPLPHPANLWNVNYPGPLVEIVDQKKAERRLQRLQARLGLDTQRGDSVAVARDVYRIEVAKHRISMDEWLIQKNTDHEPCFSPYPFPLDAMSCIAIADARRPPGAPPHVWRR